MMPFMFAPNNCYMPHRTYYRAPCYARRPCGFSPCAHPLLFFVGAFFILPTLLRLAFFALTFFALNVAPFMLIACLLRDVCEANKADANSTCHRTTTKTTTTTSTKTEDANKDNTKEEEEEEASAVVHTVSASASMSVDDDLITVTLAVPGVRSKDLDVRVIDGHVLRVTGKTTKGGGVAYQVAEDVALPVVDVDSMMATHEDGLLSITVKRKIRRVTIPITSGEEVTTSTASATSAAAAASSSNKESSEDEWEPLPVAKGRGQAQSTEAD